MALVLLLILISLSTTICCLSFRVFSVVITWLVKYGRDSKIWKDSVNRTNIRKRSLAVGTLAFKT